MVTVCLATSSRISNTERYPNEKAVLELTCPLSIGGNCVKDVPREWLCLDCGSTIEHGFDHMFYCKCGAGPAFSYSFRCCDLNHGHDFATFSQAQMDALLPPDKLQDVCRDEAASQLGALSPLAAATSYTSDCLDGSARDDKQNQLGAPASGAAVSSDDCLNILLLGETGVGKSTFINAFANYLHIEHLGAALFGGGSMQSLIFSRFVTSTHDDDKEVVTGEPDENEGGGTGSSLGSSCTRSCRAYSFSVENRKGPLAVLGGSSCAAIGSTPERKVRLIDTPGIGDTRGFDQDLENMKEIVAFISDYEVLHAICILLKPNAERLTPSFKYCILELLGRLHKGAADNITFCFTNSRSTMFRPGGTRNILKELLADIPQTSALKLNKDTMYFFDSEVFRFLAAAKAGLNFSDEERKILYPSWTQSVSEAVRLIDHIGKLRPHSTASTVSLNRVKDMLAAIELPLSEMLSVIDRNLESTRQLKQDLFKHREGTVKKIDRLVVQEIVFEVSALGHLRTICNNHACKGKICHDHCTSSQTGVYLIDNVAGLRFCEAFNFFTAICRHCGCHYASHIRVATETRDVIRERVDKDVAEAIKKRLGEEEIAELKIRVLEKREELLKIEMKQVVDAAALFASFLAQNSFVVYHPATEEYLTEQIRILSLLPEADAEVQTLAHLRDMLVSYNEHVAFYKTQQKWNIDVNITIKDVMDTLQKLYKLEENGKNLKKVMDTVKEGHRVAKREEVKFTVPQAKATKNLLAKTLQQMSRFVGHH